MRKLLFSSFGILLAMAACDVDSAIEKDLYPEQVYIVGAEGTIVDRDLDIGNQESVISISVAVSGSRPSPVDVTATVAVHPEAVEAYNSRELTSEDVPYRDLADDIYSFPADRVTIAAGTVYNTWPIHIRPATLHCDSLYMLALQLTSTSAYALNREDSVALVRLNLVNDFSGLYYMDGKIYNPDDPEDVTTYSMPRTLMATGDGKTVRMYHFSNETFDLQNEAANYRSTRTFKITVNDDNTLSLTSWDKFELVAGGGVWDEQWQTYVIEYTFLDENSEERLVKGFLYRARETDEQLRQLEDWMEQQQE